MDANVEKIAQFPALCDALLHFSHRIAAYVSNTASGLRISRNRRNRDSGPCGADAGRREKRGGRIVPEYIPFAPPEGCAAGAPVVIVPVYRKEGLVVQDMAQIDMSIAQENIWLETDALGLGGVWIGIAPMQDRMDLVHDILKLPENVEVFSLFALGYPAESRKQQDRFDESRIYFVE